MTMTMFDHIEQKKRDDEVLNAEHRRRDNMFMAEGASMAICAFHRGRKYTEEHARRLIASLYIGPSPWDGRNEQERHRRTVANNVERDFDRLIKSGLLIRDADGLLTRYTATPLAGVHDAEGNLHLINPRDVQAFHAAQRPVRRLKEMNAARKVIGLPELAELPA